MGDTVQTVEQMLAKREEHVKAIAELDSALKKIQGQIQKALGSTNEPIPSVSKKGRSKKPSDLTPGKEDLTNPEAIKKVLAAGKTMKRTDVVKEVYQLKGGELGSIRTAVYTAKFLKKDKEGLCSLKAE